MMCVVEIWNNTLYHVSQYEVVFCETEEDALEYTYDLWLDLLPGHELFCRVVPPEDYHKLPDWFDRSLLEKGH